MEWTDIKEDKPGEACELIITYLDYKGNKKVGSAWWNGNEFEDWGDCTIEDVIGWTYLPSAM